MRFLKVPGCIRNSKLTTVHGICRLDQHLPRNSGSGWLSCQHYSVLELMIASQLIDEIALLH